MIIITSCSQYKSSEKQQTLTLIYMDGDSRMQYTRYNCKLLIGMIRLICAKYTFFFYFIEKVWQRNLREEKHTFEYKIRLDANYTNVQLIQSTEFQYITS